MSSRSARGAAIKYRLFTRTTHEQPDLKGWGAHKTGVKAPRNLWRICLVARGRNRHRPPRKRRGANGSRRGIVPELCNSLHDAVGKRLLKQRLHTLCTLAGCCTVNAKILPQQLSWPREESMSMHSGCTCPAPLSANCQQFCPGSSSCHSTTPCTQQTANGTATCPFSKN